MKFLIYFLVFLPVFSSHFLQSQGFLSKTEDLTQRKSSYNTKSFFFNKAQFDLAASGFFSLYKTFSKEDLKEAKKKVFGIFDPEDLKIVGSLSIFYNGYYIPASVKMFINSEKDNSLDYEIHPINEELDALKVKLEEDLWYLIQEKKELFDMALAGKTIIVDMINEPNKMKILENEKVKGFKIRFEKKLKKLYKEKKTQFEEIQAIILIIQGASIEGMKDLKEKFANEVKSKVFELKEQLQDMKTLYEILSGKIGDFKALKKPFEARFKADIEKLKIAAEGFKDINLDEYNRLNELMKKKEELLKNLDMKSLKALLLDNVKKLLLEELKRKVKDSRIEMQLIIDKSSNEFKEKQKIFNGLFASLKSAKEKTENLKGLIEEKLKTFEPFIKEMEELAIKGLDYKSLLEKIVEPIKKRFEKEFKEVLRDKKLQFEQLKALKILIEKDSKATLDDLKAMKSYIENYLQEKSQDFNDQMTQISDKTNLEYYRLNKIET